MKINYEEYYLSMRERCLYFGQGILLCVLVNYLFYREMLIFIFMLPIMGVIVWKQKVIREVLEAVQSDPQ